MVRQHLPADQRMGNQSAVWRDHRRQPLVRQPPTKNPPLASAALMPTLPQELTAATPQPASGLSPAPPRC